MTLNNWLLTIAAFLLLLGLSASQSAAQSAAMNPEQKTIYDQLAAAAKAADPSFKGFSSARGKAFFAARQSGGRETLTSCTVCHTKDPKNSGETKKTGKAIDPMAASVNPKRYTVSKKVRKWFRRNCSDVLGRECTIMEKGDFLAYMLGT